MPGYLPQLISSPRVGDERMNGIESEGPCKLFMARSVRSERQAYRAIGIIIDTIQNSILYCFLSLAFDVLWANMSFWP